MYKKRALIVAAMVICLFLVSCTRNGKDGEPGTVIVFKHGKIAGGPGQFRELLDRFERFNPGIKVKDEALPASTDEQHQFYIVTLEGRSSDFDVLSMDVIWVPEFARAGWLTDMSRLLTMEEWKDFFPGPLQAVTFENKMYGVPWYIDAGLLFYREDLLRKHGFSPPETWQDLVTATRSILEREPGMYGFIWQGKQYEGLVCNVLEYFWSNGGDVLRDGRSVINSRNNVEALGFMRDLIVKYGTTPALVTTAIEEPTRHIFGNGRAVFMRNWPYAWNVFEKKGSVVKGKVGVSALPAFPGGTSASALGGWQLGVNRYSKHPDAAGRLVRFLASPEAQKALALTTGYKPARRSLYRDAELREKQPFITGLYEVFMKARPRPVSPYYMMITQVMQPEFSAALSGIKTPEEALAAADRQINHILRAER